LVDRRIPCAKVIVVLIIPQVTAGSVQ